MGPFDTFCTVPEALVVVEIFCAAFLYLSNNQPFLIRSDFFHMILGDAQKTGAGHL